MSWRYSVYPGTLSLDRAVDNALSLSRVWPNKNVGAIFGRVSAAAYAQRSR